MPNLNKVVYYPLERLQELQRKLDEVEASIECKLTELQQLDREKYTINARIEEIERLTQGPTQREVY